MWYYLDGSGNLRSSPGLAAACSDHICSDGEPYAPLKSTNTAEKVCLPGNKTESCPSSRFGTTCGRSMESGGAVKPTSLPADFLAKTFRRRGLGPASTVSGPDCGVKWPESLARYDHDMRSWKTRQCSLIGDSAESLVIFPRWGSMRNGELWALATPALGTNGNESGSLPTPRANDAEKRGNIDLYNPRNGLAGFVLRERIPTPAAADGRGGPGHSGRDGGLNLRTYVARQIRERIPTPAAQDAKNSTLPKSQKERDSVLGFLLRAGELPGSALNPGWVEWLMGWPTGWTGLEPLPAEKFAAWSTDPLGAWDHDPSRGEESPVPRTVPAKTIPNRPARLKAIGNGQVPQALVLAALMLWPELENFLYFSCPME